MIRKKEVPAFVLRRRRREQIKTIERAEREQAAARRQMLEAQSRHEARRRVLDTLMRWGF